MPETLRRLCTHLETTIACSTTVDWHTYIYYCHTPYNLTMQHNIFNCHHHFCRLHFTQFVQIQVLFRTFIKLHQHQIYFVKSCGEKSDNNKPEQSDKNNQRKSIFIFCEVYSQQRTPRNWLSEFIS